MSFQGQAPLLSNSELTYFPAGSQPSFTWNVAAGELTFDGGGSTFGSVFTVNASGPETDNVYVGMTAGDVTGLIDALLCGFGLDATHYLCASPASIGTPGFINQIGVYVNNGAGQSQFFAPVSPPIPYDTSTHFLTQYLAISGTMASVYSINQNTGLTALLGTIDVSSIVSAATLQTWSAGVYVHGSGGAIIKNLLWGPVSDLAPITVPPVVSLMLSPAEATIVAANLTVGTITALPNIAPAGTVTAQSPIAGTVVLFGTPVNLTVSSGLPPTTVPDLTNTSVAVVAPALLAAADLVLGTVTYSSSVLIIAGNIISQNPVGGTVVNEGTAVDVLVSTGRGPVFVPDIIDDTSADATNDILNVGLVVGTISFRESLTIPAGEVIAQNPQGGTPVASGSIVSYTISTGPPTAVPNFDVLTTVISQYANSPTILQLVESFAGYVDQTLNFVNFENFVWNVDTAQGFGLDIWGKIVNVSRLLQIPTGQRYVGFQDGTGPGVGTDVEPFGQLAGAAAGGQGVWYTNISATTAYLLLDEPYRQLILTKALANIVNTTVPAFNQLLQNLFPGRGNPYVVTSGVMAMTFHFDFHLTPVELAILQQSGAVPVPPGVSFTIVTPP